MHPNNQEPARVSLEPCPFCGEDETEVAENVTGDIVSGRQVECQYCSARGPEVLSGAKAITAWNRRTPPTSSGWQDIATAPKDGTPILALVTGASDRWKHLNGRAFVISHQGLTDSGYDLGWAVFPGFGGVSDSWFSSWAPLNLPAAPEQQP